MLLVPFFHCLVNRNERLVLYCFSFHNNRLTFTNQGLTTVSFLFFFFSLAYLISHSHFFIVIIYKCRSFCIRWKLSCLAISILYYAKQNITLHYSKFSITFLLRQKFDERMVTCKVYTSFQISLTYHDNSRALKIF